MRIVIPIDSIGRSRIDGSGAVRSIVPGEKGSVVRIGRRFAGSEREVGAVGLLRNRTSDMLAVSAAVRDGAGNRLGDRPRGRSIGQASEGEIMDRVELFTNLVAMANADGRFSPEEIAYLVHRAEQWGIPQVDAESVLIGMNEGDVELTIPTSRADRVLMLEEMIRMMAVDGELADEEKRLCATISAAMEFTAADFERILDEMLEANR